MEGRLYKPCHHICERILPCGHHVKLSCSSIISSCRKICQNCCPHKKLPHECGLPCLPCKEPCEQHRKHGKSYSRTCSEPCNQERCNEPCLEKLKCGHQCVGMYGDKCPKLCRICHKDTLEEIFFGTEDEPGARFIELEDCGHVCEVKSMDKYMDQAHISQAENDTWMKRCPQCSVIIRKSMRYDHIINTIIRDIERMKQQKLIECQNALKTKQAALQQEVGYMYLKDLHSLRT